MKLDHSVRDQLFDLLPAEMQQEGLAWITGVPVQLGPGDNSENPAASRLIVFEDQTEIGPAHTTHDRIRLLGGGSYSHWNDSLYFSTSDGSDPRTNGRRYQIGFRPLKLVVLALDGVTPRMLEQYVAEDCLPTFAKVFQQFRRVDIRTRSDLFGVSCWPCFASGQSVGSHGIHGYLPLRSGTLELLNSVDFAMPLPFWEMAARAGVCTTVLDVPHYPTPQPGSDSAAGLGKLQYIEWGPHPPQRRPSSMPPELLPRLMKRHGAHPCPVDVESLPTNCAAADHLACLCAGARRRASVIVDLIERTNPELFVAVFSEPHTATHQWLHKEAREHRCYDKLLCDTLGSPIRKVCQAVDQAIGQVLDSLPSDTTVLLACLGGERVTHGGSYFLQDILVRMGESVYPSHSTVPDSDSASWREFNNSADFYLDWSKTRAFALPWSPEGYLRINQRGREPFGIVNEGAEREELLNAIETAVRSFQVAGRSATAARVIARPQEEFAGAAAVAELPDLMVIWNNDHPIEAIESKTLGRIENRDIAVRSAHCTSGGLFAAGPLIADGPVAAARDFDIAPTILALLRLDLPKVLEGRLINELFKTKPEVLEESS